MRIRSETVVNTAVVMMCLATTYAVLDRLVLPRFSSQPRPLSYQPGDRIGDSLGDLPLERSGTTVVVYASPNCSYCNDSAAFYRRLLSVRDSASARSLQFIVVGARGVADARAFVDTHQLMVDDVGEAPTPRRHRFTGTPALLVLDATGLVVGSWSGRTGSSEEREILNSIGRRVSGHSTP
jgi:hypothetical protein